MRLALGWNRVYLVGELRKATVVEIMEYLYLWAMY
jgi:hypothetical protein